MKPEYTEYYKITDPETVNKILSIRNEKLEWMKQWNLEAERRGFDKASIIRDEAYLGLFQGRFKGFVINFDKIGTVDLEVYKFIHQDKPRKENTYAVRKVNKKEYAKFKAFADSIGGTKNMNAVTEIMLGVAGTFGGPIAEINFGVKDHILTRLAWFARDRENYKLSEHMIRIKESEHLALQGK